MGIHLDQKRMGWLDNLIYIRQTANLHRGEFLNNYKSLHGVLLPLQHRPPALMQFLELTHHC